MNGFSKEQLRKLSKLLDRRHVQSRELDGRKLDYIEGWFAISEANAIFGFAGWDRQMCHFERSFERVRADEVSCGYVARVRLRVRAGMTVVVREGTGWGCATARTSGEAHERAVKSAETDATKRALATFGNRFGLGLYDKDQAGVTPLHQPAVASSIRTGADVFSLTAPDGEILSLGLSPEGFCSAMRQLVESGLERPMLLALRDQNKAIMNRLRSEVPKLVSPKGEHYVDILDRLVAKRTQERPFDDASAVSSTAGALVPPVVSSTTANDAESGVGQEQGALNRLETANDASSAAEARPSRIGNGSKVEKSQLQFASERRVRNKAHLALVASRPCLICGDLPCHAHHITFAQRRDLSVKVSDEFTVPLCVIHHNELHGYGSERGWWAKQGIEPLSPALTLWQESLGS